MKWFLVKILFRIVCGNGEHPAQFDEQLRLIHATDACDAMEKATAIGIQEQESFFNQQQQPVAWQLVAVTDIYPVSYDMDGAEVFSRISEEQHPALFIHTMQLRSAGAVNRCHAFAQY